MANEVTVGVIGVVGTIVGGAITSVASWATGRSQRESSLLAVEREKEKDQQERHDKILETGREACVDYMVAVSGLLNDARALWEKLGIEGSRDHLAEEHKNYETGWRELTILESTLQVMGPADLAKAAAVLRIAIGGYCEVIDEAYQTVPLPQARADEAYAKVSGARSRFTEKAQSTFGVGL